MKITIQITKQVAKDGYLLYPGDTYDARMGNGCVVIHVYWNREVSVPLSHVKILPEPAPIG